MAAKIDRIAQLLNCPEKGEQMRRAVTETRKEFLLNQPEDDLVEEDEVFDEAEEEGVTTMNMTSLTGRRSDGVPAILSSLTKKPRTITVRGFLV